jgi:hypothetical protein
VSLRALQRCGGCADRGMRRLSAGAAWGQEEVIRRLKSKIAPTYPDLARRMNLSGVVKVKVTVATHRYVSGNEETTGIVEFRFDATQ